MTSTIETKENTTSNKEKIKLYVCKETLKHHLSIKYNEFFVSLGQSLALNFFYRINIFVIA